MASPRVESLRVEVEEELLSLPLAGFRKLMQGLLIPKAQWDGQSKMKCITGMHAFLQERAEEEPDKQVDLLTSVRHAIEVVKHETDRGEDKPIVDAEIRTSDTSIRKVYGEPVRERPYFDKHDATSSFRREFKITGMVGDAGEKDRLTYLSLLRQLKEGERKGYTDGELVSACIRAIGPGIPLRSYLETLPSLPLKRLRKFLRSHYKEKSATELYRQLTSLTQMEFEDECDFMFRCFEIRSKVCLASDEEGHQKYDLKLVQSLCLETICTGLRNKSVLAQFQPHVTAALESLSDDVESTDVALISEMRRLTKQEAAWQSKMIAKQRSDTDNAVNTAARSNPSKSRSVNVHSITEEPRENTILQEIRKLQVQVTSIANIHDEVAQLRAQVAAITTPSASRESDEYRMSIRCRNCNDKNIMKCNHCTRCGGDNHFARNCRLQAPQAAKERELPRGGRQ